MKVSNFLSKREIFLWALIGALLFQFVWYAYNYYVFDVTIKNVSSVSITDISLENEKVKRVIRTLGAHEEKRLIFLRSQIGEGKELKISFKAQSQHKSIVVFNGDSQEIRPKEYGRLYISKNEPLNEFNATFSIVK